MKTRYEYNVKKGTGFVFVEGVPIRMAKSEIRKMKEEDRKAKIDRPKGYYKIVVREKSSWYAVPEVLRCSKCGKKPNVYFDNGEGEFHAGHSCEVADRYYDLRGNTECEAVGKWNRTHGKKK